MINYLEGTIKHVDEKSILLVVGGVGFNLMTPLTNNFIIGKQVSLFTYLHWSQENGPSMYGFADEVSRSLFLLIIDCPKIGPSIAMAILNALAPAQFIEAVTSQNDKVLSNITGIGVKKAEQIITHLKHKVPKLILKGELKVEAQEENSTNWHHVSEALASLNYSRQEITTALHYLAEKYAGQPAPLDQLIRAGLTHLAKNKNFIG